MAGYLVSAFTDPHADIYDVLQHADTSYVRDEPYRRVIFHRDGKGNVERFQLLPENP
jgi:hypothetical protein